MMLGRYEEAEHALRSVIEEAGEMGLTRAVAAARHNLGLVLACRGDFANAEAEEIVAVRELAAMNDERLSAVSRVYLAMILEMAGELERAEKIAREAIDERRGASAGSSTRALRARARALAPRARRRGRARVSAESVVALESTRVEGGDAYPRVVRVEALLAVGRREDAITALREASRALTVSAERIQGAEDRELFLSRVPENALTVALAREHLPS